MLLMFVTSPPGNITGVVYIHVPSLPSVVSNENQKPPFCQWFSRYKDAKELLWLYHYPKHRKTQQYVYRDEKVER